MKKRLPWIAAAATAAAALFYFFGVGLLPWAFAPTPTVVRKGVALNDAVVPEMSGASPAQENTVTRPDIEVVARDLDIPWEIAFLPDGDMLVTERPGTLLRIGKAGSVIKVQGVAHVGEGGLLGLALHPDFAMNGLLYLYLTTRSGDGLTNRVERYRLEADALSERTVIIEDIPGAIYHDGGRLAFGPDGMLYITTGDSGNSALAQDTSSLAGKILRLRPDGSIPDDNPFKNAVYSYGHRNPQGLAWDGTGRLWATEHGRSGALSGLDELNLIKKGKNYGWPAIQGDAKKLGMESPVAQSGASDTWAPAGAAFLDGSVFFAGLRGESLYEAKITSNGTNVTLLAHLRNDFGRLRAVVLGPDGALYVSTSNKDGRGKIASGDDKIIRINPAIFKK